MLSLEILDLTKVFYDECSTFIPFAAYPCSRVRIDRIKSDVSIEYAQVNYYWNDTLQEEEEEWTWRRAFHQPDKETQNKLLKELERYAEIEAVLQNKVC